MKQVYTSRRIKVLIVDDVSIADLFNDTFCSFSPNIEYIPKGARLVHFDTGDYNCNYCFVFEHESFRPIMPGSCPPVIRLKAGIPAFTKYDLSKYSPEELEMFKEKAKNKPFPIINPTLLLE